jgi:TolA-binding protein
MARFALRVTTASALVLTAMIASSSALHPARAQESERPFGLFGLFNGSERLGGERGAPAADADRTGQASGPDAVLRIERLENQIRQLTGTIEQLQFRNQQLESQIRRMQEEGAPRSAVQLRPQNPASPSAAPSDRRGDAFDPSQNPNAPGSPHALGSMNAPVAAPSMSADASDQPVGAPGARGAGAPLDLATVPPPNGAVPGQSTRNPAAGGGALATLPPSQTPRDEYDLAYGYMCAKTMPSPKPPFAASSANIPMIGSSAMRPIGWVKACSSGSAFAMPQKPSSTSRPNMNPSARRLMRFCAWDNRSPRSARRTRPAHRSAKSCENSPARRRG